jgi:pentatricopeptide repeat protein
MDDAPDDVTASVGKAAAAAVPAGEKHVIDFAVLAQLFESEGKDGLPKVRIFSCSGILLVAHRQYSHALASHWLHTDNILMLWHPIGHTQVLWHLNVFLRAVGYEQGLEGKMSWNMIKALGKLGKIETALEFFEAMQYRDWEEYTEMACAYFRQVCCVLFAYEFGRIRFLHTTIY